LQTRHKLSHSADLLHHVVAKYRLDVCSGAKYTVQLWISHVAN